MLLWTAGLLVGGALAAFIAALIANRALSTDAPGLLARLSTYTGSNVATVEPDSRFPELRSPVYAHTPREVTLLAGEVARQLGFEQIEVDTGNQTVNAVAVTPLLRFSDDIEVRVHKHERGSSLSARSASRIGRGDLGANQNHLRRLLDGLETRLTLVPDEQ